MFEMEGESDEGPWLGLMSGGRGGRVYNGRLCGSSGSSPKMVTSRGQGVNSTELEK